MPPEPGQVRFDLPPEPLRPLGDELGAGNDDPAPDPNCEAGDSLEEPAQPLADPAEELAAGAHDGVPDVLAALGREALEWPPDGFAPVARFFRAALPRLGEEEQEQEQEEAADHADNPGDEHVAQPERRQCEYEPADRQYGRHR